MDLDAAEAAKARIGELVAGTRTPLSTGQVGAFGGMVRVPAGMRKPTLVLSTDGVGTKVLVAMQAERFDTVGEDLVNHSVNDILVHGATPIAFMDYIAGAGLGVEQIAGIVEGIARGCRAHGMALAGGETAQMPGLYQPGTYDLAGTIIGVVEEDRALHGDAIVPGRRPAGIRVHRAAHQRLYPGPAHRLRADGSGAGRSAGGHRRRPWRRRFWRCTGAITGASVPVLDRMHGLAHITGGGIAGNLVRILPAETARRR